jgi:hypothetical protein
MTDDAEVLKRTEGMPARERAAAIAHTIYILAGQAIPGWQIRVPTEWQDLSPDAKSINLASIDAWAEHEELLKAWIDAVQKLRKPAD